MPEMPPPIIATSYSGAALTVSFDSAFLDGVIVAVMRISFLRKSMEIYVFLNLCRVYNRGSGVSKGDK